MVKLPFTPLNFEKTWLDTENKFAARIAANSGCVFFFLIAFILGVVLTYKSWTGLSLPGWGRFFIAQDRYWATLVIMSGAFVHYIIKPKNRLNIVFLSMLMIGAWLFPLDKLGALRGQALYPFLYILIGSFTLRFIKIRKIFLLLFFVLLFFFMISGLYQDAIGHQNGKILQYFAVLHLDALLLYFIHRIYAGRSLNQIFDFNPLQLYSPLPIPAQSKMIMSRQEQKVFFVKGFLQITQAQIVYFLLLNTASLDVLKKTENPYLHYLVFLISIVAGMKMLTGILWMYGFQVKPASYFIILAKTPLEIWQRGSTYLADFAFFNIYLPLWKRLRTNAVPALAIIAFVFFHLFFFHEVIVKAVMSHLFPGTPIFALDTEVFFRQVLWILLWVVWIFLFLFIMNKFPKLKLNNRTAWALVLLNHLGSASIIPATFYLMKILPI